MNSTDHTATVAGFCFNLEYIRKMLSLLVISALAVFGFSAAYTPEALADKIVKLPGTDALSITFNQFSGYLDIPGNSGNSKHIHYWLVESIQNPAKDPVTFWTNGGPGQ